MQTHAEAMEGNTPTLAKCPIDHTTISQQKTPKIIEPAHGTMNYDAANDIWNIYGFEAARAILRSPHTRQAGFNAEVITRIPNQKNTPILYQEGKVHQQQRKQTARFFTPKAVSDNYRQLMEELSDRLIQQFKREKKIDLSQLSMQLAVRVAGEIVGLTNSRLPGMDKRIEAFFEQDFAPGKGKLMDKVRAIWAQRRMLSFFYLDVKPAIDARRRAPKQDVISHLLEQKYSDAEILVECVTYGAAGMITTREFISVAAWHLLEQPELRERYLAESEEKRFDILHEILRLEPIVGNLQRRTTAEIKLEANGQEMSIPAGALINIHLHSSNTDQEIVGDYPRVICPGRDLQGERVPTMIMSFGDGAHRCPGAYVAIQETDIFLTRLLALKELRMTQKPKVSWSDLVTGYEIREFLLALD
ncbi:cytochrome P450 [Tengunoibacter tsumagoiensis]|uniref:Cytochrome P450 n=1 Tax=Tengunoibacter tsumagoiensis TaxID=2014871 RepID=A0A402A186_9CHLR|nr:cytochrome P450 [Tengunoibacter tsumagoiensis]GCE12835.1 hypothetical protein KTT_26940 [Tengunoibacter tsumagoiensis]